MYNTVMRTVYIETSIVSYLTSRPSRDIRVAAWQEITTQWWEQERSKYELFTSELVIAEAGGGDEEAARKRLDRLKDIPVLTVDDATKRFAGQLIQDGGVPSEAQADALHIAIASVHRLDYLLTWNCRHIDNAAAKPLIRSICAIVGYPCPEICTPLELLSEDRDHVPR
jgi:predicted nucleic acid-binding protein